MLACEGCDRGDGSPADGTHRWTMKSFALRPPSLLTVMLGMSDSLDC